MHTEATATPRRPRTRAVVVAGTILLAVIAVRLLGTEQADLPTRVSDFLTLTFSVLVESLPFVILGILLSIAIQVWLPAGIIERVLPRNAFARRACISLLGMFFPVCECGNVPLARGLMMRGFTPAESLTFVMAAPILNPIVIVTTHQAFGWSGGILVWRLVGGFVLANLVGWIFSRRPLPQNMLTPQFAAACEADTHGGTRIARSLSQFRSETAAVIPALIVGCALAGAVQVFFPREILAQVGQDPFLSIAVMMLLAVVVSICSTVDAFFALSFSAMFLPGALVAFLVLGPVIDIKMIALLRSTYTSRVLAMLCIIAVLFVGALGLVANLVG